MNITKENLEHMEAFSQALQVEIEQFKAQNAAPVGDWPMSVEDLPEPDHYYMIDCGEVRYMDSHGCDSTDFATEADAKSALAFAQLSRLIRHINKGWEPDWNNKQYCYRVVFDHSKDFKNLCVFSASHVSEIPDCLIFRNGEEAERSIETHRPLWLDYFQVDEQEV